MKLTPEQKEVHKFQLANFDHDAYLAAQVGNDEEEEDENGNDRTADDYADYSYSTLEYGN